MRHSGLTVIADADGRASLPPVITGDSIPIIDVRNVEVLASIGDRIVLIDVDLRNIENVSLIKNSLPADADKQLRIIAVDRGSHRCEIQAKGLGASALIKRPWNIDDLKACLRNLAARLPRKITPNIIDDEALKQAPGGISIASAALQLKHLFDGLISGGPVDIASAQQASGQVMAAISDMGLGTWLETVRRYHEGTFQHCLIVTGVLTNFGQKTGMRNSDILTLTVAGLLHDIGKAQIPLAILDKPGKLTPEEFAPIKRHPVIGYDYLRDQGAFSADTLAAVRHHHEYLDGSGYPDGLGGQQIGDLTRVMTICDIYGALVERRAYKTPESSHAAIIILTEMAKNGKVEYELVRALQGCMPDSHHS